jgi:hypothetical protein
MVGKMKKPKLPIAQIYKNKNKKNKKLPKKKK